MIGRPLAVKLYAALGQLKRDGLLNERTWIECAADIIDAEFDQALGGPRPAKVPREVRDRLFEAIAKASGCNVEEITKRRAAEITTAVKDILRVSPLVEPAEVERRGRKFREKHPTWTLTPSSLAKWWDELSAPKADIDTYKEPPPGWREHAVRIAGPEYADASWEMVRPAYGRRIWQAVA